MAYNNFVYNSGVYNGGPQQAGPAQQDDIVFNDFGLQNANVKSSLALYDQGPVRDLPINKIPRNDGEFITGDFWRRKIVTISGTVRGSTQADLNTRLDDMKKALAVRESNLDIRRDGVIRRFVSTLVNAERMFDRRNFHLTFIPFAAQFLCLTPYGQSTTYQEDLFVGKTDLVSTEFTNNDGTIRSKPVISLNFSAAASITNIKIENNTTSETIESAVSVSAGDIIVFDSELFTVTKNGTEIDYSGFFPNLATGGNSITITLTGTSAQFTLSIKHKTSYL